MRCLRTALGLRTMRWQASLFSVPRRDCHGDPLPGCGPRALDDRAKPGQQPAGRGAVRRGGFVVMVIVLIRTFAACLVVLRSFIIVVFGLVEAVGGLGCWALAPGQILRGLGLGSG